MTDLSVVIVNWNAGRDLLACLESLSAHEKRRDMEVWVVDNASSDGSVEIARLRFPSVQWIINARNLGFARAVNQGLARSRGRYLLLLNPDLVAHPGALSAMMAVMDRRPEIGVLGPKVLHPDGSLQYSCRTFPTLGAMLFRGTWLSAVAPRSRFVRHYTMADWSHTHLREVDWVSGSAMMVRRAAMKEVGLLDERFFLYCEDMDWCARFHAAGWKVVYFPGAVVTHAIGRSSDQRFRGAVLDHHRSMWLYFQKHYAPRWGRWTVFPAGLFLASRALYTLLGTEIRRRLQRRRVLASPRPSPSPALRTQDLNNQ